MIFSQGIGVEINRVVNAWNELASAVYPNAAYAEYEYNPFGKVIAHTAEAVFRVRNSCCDPERTGLSVISEKEMGEMIIW